MVRRIAYLGITGVMPSTPTVSSVASTEVLLLWSEVNLEPYGAKYGGCKDFIGNDHSRGFNCIEHTESFSVRMDKTFLVLSFKLQLIK